MRAQAMGQRVDAATGGSFAARAAAALEEGERQLRDRQWNRFTTPEAIEWVRATLRQLVIDQSERGCAWHAEGRADRAAACSGRALVVEELIDHLDDRLVLLEAAAAAAAAPVGPPPASPAEVLAEVAKWW